MTTNELEDHIHLIEKAIKEFSKEPASKPREQFEAEIDAIVHLVAYTKCLYPNRRTGPLHLYFTSL